MTFVERLAKAAENIVLALPRWAYRRVVVEEQRRDAHRLELLAVRDALIEANAIEPMTYGNTAAWAATRTAVVRAAGLAAASGDSELAALVNAYRDAHDELAHNWTRATPEMWAALRSTLETAMRRVAALLNE